MRRIVAVLVVFILAAPVSSCETGLVSEIIREIPLPSQEALDESTIVAGLKEAITLGTQNAATTVAKRDGYFGNVTIRILMPENMQNMAETLEKIGFRRQVNDFVLSMNRAAERAAPTAKSLFVEAIREMTFHDAQNILYGNDTAATDYFRVKTTDKLYAAFKPVIATSMNEVGVTRFYKKMVERYMVLPFAKEQAFDLDHYVTNKALNGLFYMVAQEEKKIRTDPAARVTELLRRVFASA